MTFIARGLRQRVVRRAGNRCEYCGIRQVGQEARFHVDHVIPLAAGGTNMMENLALACVSCSLHKAARLTATDPRSGLSVRIFDPRREAWAQHFRWKGVVAIGRTATGRATVAALQMNRPLILAIRAEEAARGRFP